MAGSTFSWWRKSYRLSRACATRGVSRADAPALRRMWAASGGMRVSWIRSVTRTILSTMRCSTGWAASSTRRLSTSRKSMPDSSRWENTRASADLNQEPLESGEAEEIVSTLGRWISQFDQEQVNIVEGLPLPQGHGRLAHLFARSSRDRYALHGKLPLKAVREIAAGPGQPACAGYDDRQGVYRLRSEEDVWPIYFLHLLAVDGVLISGGMGQRWQLTPQGEGFLTLVPPAQVWILFATWFTQTNWMNAYPYIGLGTSLPAVFKQAILSPVCQSSGGMGSLRTIRRRSD